MVQEILMSKQQQQQQQQQLKVAVPNLAAEYRLDAAPVAPFSASLKGSCNNSRGGEQGTPKDDAAVTMQKLYRGYRTRRQLADCALKARNYEWWNVLEGVVLKQNSEQFYSESNQDDVAHKWFRLQKKAAVLGRGLLKDKNAQKLAFQHWLEAIDARHRYGHNLHKYYKAWSKTDTREPFFYWLDVGEGKNVDLRELPRSRLSSEQIMYLGPKERKDYEVTIKNGKWYFKQTMEVVDTTDDEKWIFVMSPSGSIYVGMKVKGKLQHSSFLAGGAAKAAGRLSVRNGVLELLEPHSGHYRPTAENFENFLKVLKERGINLENVKVHFASDEMCRLASKARKNSMLRETSEDFDAKTLAEDIKLSHENEVMSNVVNNAIAHRKADEGTQDNSSTKEEEQQQQQQQRQQQQQDEQQQQQQHSKPSILKRFRPATLKLRRQTSATWSSGVGCRLSSLSIIPPSVRTQALEVIHTPRLATARW